MGNVFALTKRISSLILLALCVGCAAHIGLKDRIAVGYDAVEAYTNLAGSLLLRERISIDQARKARKNADSAKQALDFAAGIGACPGEPCTVQDQLISAEQILLQLERDLKE